MKKILIALIALLTLNTYSQNSSGILPFLNTDTGISPLNFVYIQAGTNIWQKTDVSHLVLPISQINNLQTSLDSKYPISGNPSGFLTVEVDGSTTNEIQSLSIVGNTLNLSLGGGSVGLPIYTPGTGISILSNTINNTSPDQIVSLTGANNFGVTGTYPNFTLTQYVPTNNTVTRTINNSTYTISSTKPATVKYNIKIACTATIGSASSGKVLFQYSIDGGTNWIDAGEVENSNTVSLAIVLNSTTNQSGFIVWSVPANALCRLVPTTSGTTTITWIRGQETY